MSTNTCATLGRQPLTRRNTDETSDSFDENKELMQRYLLGPRKLAPKRKRGQR
jgi:hypothetical protein